MAEHAPSFTALLRARAVLLSDRLIIDRSLYSHVVSAAPYCFQKGGCGSKAAHHLVFRSLHEWHRGCRSDHGRVCELGDLLRTISAVSPFTLTVVPKGFDASVSRWRI